MGYTTDFTGSVSVEPPLNAAEVDFLTRFADSRRFNRPEGPYALHENRGYGRTNDGYNQPAAGQPSLWCNWAPTADGAAIVWNGAEKFYDSVEWMQYLIDTFLKEDAVLQNENSARVTGRCYDPAFASFTFDHVVNGVIDAQGEDPDDTWQLVVAENHAAKVEPGSETAPEVAAKSETDQDTLVRLLGELVDEDDCWFDHHGGCQAHGFLSLGPGEKCPHAEAKELLARLSNGEAGR